MKKIFYETVMLKSSYKPVKYRNGITVASYDMKTITSESDEKNSNSQEEVVSCRQIAYTGKPNAQTIYADIINDIDSRAKNDIYNGFSYNNKPVYLSLENQQNFSAAYTLAKITDMAEPVTLRISFANYLTFTKITDLENFINTYTRYINDTLKKYWTMKENINQNYYEFIY